MFVCKCRFIVFLFVFWCVVCVEVCVGNFVFVFVSVYVFVCVCLLVFGVLVFVGVCVRS